MVRETCEIRATKVRFRVLNQVWRFEATTPDGVVVAASPDFTSSAFVVNEGRSERATLGALFDRLTADGWMPQNRPAVLSRGEAWYRMNLYRESA